MQKTKDKNKDSASNSAENENDNTAHVAYVSQKTQRLAGALYALTRSFPTEEPLREALRNQALNLVSSAHALSDGAPATDTVGELPALLNRLRSQLAVAKDGGLISTMNHSVLDEEIRNFIAEIQEIDCVPGPNLNGEYFDGEIPALTDGDAAGRNISRRNSSSVGESGQSSAGGGADTGGSSNSSSRQSAKEKRRQRILDLFEDQSEITVNDVTEVVSGYSTKTIQRDLKALVKAGELDKHGKRRWTSYTRNT